jgi:TolB-like protein/Tfp pilus assembly protein PilF
LAPKAFDTLVALLRRSGDIVNKDELMQAIWPDTFVEEINLAVNVSVLRRAFGDNPNDHRYIATVPGRGYSFVASVRVRLEDDSDVEGAESLLHQAVQAEPPIRSMAVLPFTVRGEDKRDEYLGFGLADVLIGRLSGLRQVVRPTSAVVGLAGSDPLVVGRRLRVDALLDGTIRLANGRVRVTAQLVRVRDGVTLWADTLDEKFTDLFAVEDSIAKRVVEALRMRLVPTGEGLLGRRTDSTDAYHAYLKGRYCWNKRTEEGCAKGIEYFQKAIASDPAYAMAYAGLADCYIFLSIYCALPPTEGFPRATAVATKALAIDDGLAEAHTSLAYAMLLYHWDFATAEREFKRALDLNPHYATAHAWYSDYFLAMARFDEAMAAMSRALELDPLSLMINANIGEILLLAGLHEGAIEQLRKTIELDPHFATSHYLLGLAYCRTGRREEALAEVRAAIDVTQGSVFLLPTLGCVYAAAGYQDQALGVVAQLKDLSKHRYVSPYGLALIYAALGDHQAALDSLEQSWHEHSPWLVYLNVERQFDLLRSNRRFTELLGRIGLSR